MRTFLENLSSDSSNAFTQVGGLNDTMALILLQGNISVIEV